MTEVTTVPDIATDRRWAPFIIYRFAFIVSVLTLLSAIPRFVYLDQPPLWGDEAATFARVCSTFQTLVDELAVAGFAPLHYLLYWTIGQFTPLTPFVVRLPPAIAGTLMVPAVYALAVQIVSRRTALLAALLTACSAYMLNYARDAKMYAELWLFVTLSTACLLWAIRTRHRFAWYLWVICGLLMVGLHTLGVAVLAIQTILFLANRRLHWMNVVWFIAGMAVILGPIFIYYKAFNRYHERIERVGWQGTGIGWVEAYNRGRDGGDLLGFTASAFGYGWEWPRLQDQPGVRERTLKLLKGSGIAMLALLAIGVFPWRDPLGRAALAGSGAQAVLQRWIPLLWIGAWLVLPAYGFYVASMRQPLPPWRWIVSLQHFAWEHPWLLATLGLPLVALALWAVFSKSPRLKEIVIVLFTGEVLLGLCAVLWCVIPRQDGSVWMPRYLGFVWPAFAIAAAALLMRLPTRPLRWSAVTLICIVNLVQHGARVYAGSEPPTDRMVRDLLASRTADSDTGFYYRMAYRGRGDPGSGLLNTPPANYYQAIYTGRPTTPSEIRFGWSRNRTGRNPRRIASPYFVMNSLIPLEMFIPTQLAQHSEYRTLIVWDQLNPGQIELTDKLGEKLAGQWQRTSEALYPIRDHWTWRDLCTARRRVYQRREPTTRPDARNANQSGP